jgi:sialic acid synthase SpsE
MFERTFIIAEAGANHNGNLETALRLVDAARAAGADAVKFQDFTLDALFSPRHYRETLGLPESWSEPVARVSFRPEWHPILHEHARRKGIHCFATPFSVRSVQVQKSLVPFFKVSSGDITNVVLLERLARAGKGVFVSTGAATRTDVERAVRLLGRGNLPFICLMHCVMLYPPPDESLHLRSIPALAQHYDLPVGFSDHTTGCDAALASVALGARALEKHFTLDRSQEGGDHANSLDPQGFAGLVSRVRSVEKMLGRSRKTVTEREAAERVYARRGLYATRDLRKGDIVGQEDIVPLRPNIHIGAEFFHQVAGSRLTRDLEKGEPFTQDVLEKNG